MDVRAHGIVAGPVGGARWHSKKCVDALEQRDETPPAEKNALCCAPWELPADDEAQAESTLRKLDTEEWGRVLPPCVVLHTDKPARVAVHVEPATETVRWTLTLEDGGLRHGEAATASLEHAGSLHGMGTRANGGC